MTTPTMRTGPLNRDNPSHISDGDRLRSAHALRVQQVANQSHAVGQEALPTDASQPERSLSTIQIKNPQPHHPFPRYHLDSDTPPRPTRREVYPLTASTEENTISSERKHPVPHRISCEMRRRRSDHSGTASSAGISPSPGILSIHTDAPLSPAASSPPQS